MAFKKVWPILLSNVATSSLVLYAYNYKPKYKYIDFPSDNNQDNIHKNIISDLMDGKIKSNTIYRIEGDIKLFGMYIPIKRIIASTDETNFNKVADLLEHSCEKYGLYLPNLFDVWQNYNPKGVNIYVKKNMPAIRIRDDIIYSPTNEEAKNFIERLKNNVDSTILIENTKYSVKTIVDDNIKKFIITIPYEKYHAGHEKYIKSCTKICGYKSYIDYEYDKNPITGVIGFLTIVTIEIPI